MAVSLDSMAKASTLSSTSLTFSHTCDGNSRVLLVGVSVDAGGAISGVTYKGTALTQIFSTQSTGTTQRSAMFGLVAPATGANNVVITLSTAANGIVGGSVSFNNASQTGGWGTAVTTAATTNAPSITVTSLLGEMVVANTCWGIDATNKPTATVGAGLSAEWNDVSLTNESAGSGVIQTGSTSVILNWTLSSGNDWVMGGVNVLAATAPNAGSKRL